MKRVAWTKSKGDPEDSQKPAHCTNPTYLHGLQHVTDHQRGKLSRSIWLIAVLGMVVAATYIIVTQMMLFMSNPFVTQTTLLQKTKFQFPTITICNLNPFRKSMMNESWLVSKYVGSVYRSAEVVSLSDEEVREIDSRIPDPEKFLMRGGYRMNQSLVSCIWKNKRVNCSEYFTRKHTDWGYCFVFNSKKFAKRYGSYLTYDGIGVGNGLIFMFDIQQDEYITYGGSHAAGVKVLAHTPGMQPSMASKGFMAAPGFMTFAPLTYTEYKVLPAPFEAFLKKGDYCLDTKADTYEHKLQFFKEYSVDACMNDCFIRAALDKCGCKNPLIEGNAKPCTPSVYINCVIPAQQEAISSCRCQQPCSWVTYTPVISVAALSSIPYMSKFINSTGASRDYIQNNFVSIAVYYETMVYTRIEQIASYEITDMIANIGGELGVFLGASFLTMIELQEWLIIKISDLINRCRTPKTDASQ